jgi:hypothetical protein
MIAMLHHSTELTENTELTTVYVEASVAKHGGRMIRGPEKYGYNSSVRSIIVFALSKKSWTDEKLTCDGAVMAKPRPLDIRTVPLAKDTYI